RHRRTTHARDPPDDVRQVVGDDHRAARVHGHAHRAAAGGAVVVAEAGGEVDRIAGRAAVAERHEHHLVAGGVRTVPAAVHADEGAIGELRAHHRAGEVHAQRGDVRTQAVVGRDRGRDLLRIRRLRAGVDVLAPVRPGPAVEAAVAHRGQVVGHQVRADLVALVDHGPELAAAGLDGERGGIAQAGRVGAVHAGGDVDLPDHRAVLLGEHAALGDVAVGA